MHIASIPSLDRISLHHLKQSVSRRDRPDTTLLPELRHLDIENILDNDEQVYLCGLFITATLTDLRFRVGRRSQRALADSTDAFCEQLQRTTGGLRCLDLDIGGRAPNHGALEHLLEAQPLLRSVKLGAACQDIQILMALSRLNFLVRMELRDWSPAGPDENTGFLGQAKLSFPALESVCADPDTAAQIVDLANHTIPSVRLVAALVGHSLQITNPLHSSTPTTSLRITPALGFAVTDIHLKVILPSRGGIGHKKPIAVLNNLWMCSNLRKLQVQGSIHNSELWTLGTKKWPLLESLTWTSSVPHGGVQNAGATWATLGSISRCCPELRYLDIPVEASGKLPAAEVFARLTQMRSLEVYQ